MFEKEKFICLTEIQPMVAECYAHRKENTPKESIIKHTELCEKYFLQIIKKKRICGIIISFKDWYLGNISKEASELFELMLMNVISLHDVGKINPHFQHKKMQYREAKGTKPDNNVGSRHSILSAVIYLQYFLTEVSKLEEKQEKIVMRDFAYLHSFVIAKHHGALNELKSYLDSFDEYPTDPADNLGWHAKMWLSEWEKEMNGMEAKAISPRTEKMKKRFNKKEDEKKRFLFAYVRLVHSLLVASDYYATSEYMNGVEVNEFGEIINFQNIYQAFNETTIIKGIRAYEKTNFPLADDQIGTQDDINILRTEIFLEAEQTLKVNQDKYLYYLEAPTGSGKSNTALNLSFQLMQMDKKLKKIFYIYPFNTLVEQNMDLLYKIFEAKEDIISQVAVVNSLVPLKEDEDSNYQKVLLDRQFLNYPIILSTHVSLFHTMFDKGKEALFGFHQLCNSIIVLDEIQSYKNEIWSEIICFFKSYAKLLNIKIIIMSATLPNLEVLTDNEEGAVPLIENREKYFTHSLFANRVAADYSLLDQKITLEKLATHVLESAKKEKKILIEFIKKESAYEFFDILFGAAECEVLLMTGDTSILERKLTIARLDKLTSVILIATQVIEAGVDIDMDIGYKDFSKLDSEEQFMGRINRSCKKNGIVYFFDLDSVTGIYKGDIRSDLEFTLKNEEMRKVLASKNYSLYYARILECLKARGQELNENNLKRFFSENVGYLDYPNVEARMKLIDSKQMVSVYLARCIDTEEGTVINGTKIWREYKELLEDSNMDYAEKQVKIFRLKSVMNGFIYQINRYRQFEFEEQIGDIYYIENGEDYFENGILNRKKLGEEEDLFL